ncbi:MAG: hypothetical protein U1B94_04475 [candidate division NC10 bacterium]|nr:hypothetical protein [candidate division NC10 bacterium]
MRNVSVAMVCLALLTGCASTAGTAVLSGAVGAGAAGGGYELHLKNQKNRVEEDFKAGRIDKREYEIRKDQIARDSLLQ